MALIVDRMMRAARLDPVVFREAAADEGAMGQAMAVVAISAAAAGIGASGLGGPLGLVAGAVGALVGWFVWAFLCHLIGTRLLREPQTRADLAPVLRAVGFAAAPGVIRILGIIPLLGPLVGFVANLWMLAAFVVAVREVLGYADTGRAVAVCAIGFVVQMIVFGLIALMFLGSALLLFLPLF